MSIGRVGRVEGTFEKPVVGLPYIIAYEITVGPEGSEVVVVLRLIHGARDWPDNEWPADR